MSKKETDDFFYKLATYIDNPELGYDGLMYITEKKYFFDEYPELQPLKHFFKMKNFNRLSDYGLFLGNDQYIYNFPYLLKIYIERRNGSMPLSQMGRFYEEFGCIKRYVRQQGLVYYIKYFGFYYGMIIKKGNIYVLNANIQEDIKYALIEFVELHNGEVNCSSLPEFYEKHPKLSNYIKRIGIENLINEYFSQTKNSKDSKLIWNKGCIKLANYSAKKKLLRLNPNAFSFDPYNNALIVEKESKDKFKSKIKKNWDYNYPNEIQILAPKPKFLEDFKTRIIIPLDNYDIPEKFTTYFKFSPKINIMALEACLLKTLNSIKCSQTYEKNAINYSMIDLSNLIDFFDFFQMIMFVEEVKMNLEMCSYDLEKAKFSRDQCSFQNNLYEVDMPGLAERRPSILVGDRVILKYGNNKIVASIWKVKENSILVSFPSFMSNKIYECDVHFQFNRTPIKLMHRALEKWSNAWLLHGFFSNWFLPALPNIELTFLSRELNEMQSKVVQALLKSCETPFEEPLIIFGPPGTGKTATIVEGTIQILKKKSDSRILICTPSNSAADLICERLIKAFELKGEKIEYKNFTDLKLIRINAASRDPDSVSQTLKDKCQVYFTVPSNEVIKSGNVIVTTGISAGYFVTLRLQIFSHIFFDEAGESLVGETLIPFSLKNEDTTIILAGDPKQLGPIVISPLCLKYGMDISLLERLFNLKLKQLNKEIPSVEDLLKVGVFHLIDNYRAHAGILKIYNDQFYYSKLQTKGDQTLIQWRGLKNPDIPLLFKNVIGQEEREEDSPSWFNQTEINEIFAILNDLKNQNLLINKNVGIISPYRKQCAKIRKRLKTEGFSNVDVGTTEFFQGDERDIIIITSVRSKFNNVGADLKYHLGFIAKPKRINVSISRAKNLLIILGNAELLYSDSTFKQILEKIYEMGCYEGPRF